MASVSSLDLSSTPIRAASEEPSRYRRDSMEELDSSAQRKRPRLDCAVNGSHRSMSADPKTPSLSSSSARLNNEDIPIHTCTKSDSSSIITTPTSPTVLDAPRPLIRTPSKVTINTKTRSATTQDNNIRLEDEKMTDPLGDASAVEDDDNNDKEKDESCDKATPSVTDTCDSSSPQSIPEIEVELEDMDQDSSEDKWQPLVEVVENLQDIIDRFPLVMRGLRHHEAINRIAQVLSKGNDDGESDVFLELISWMGAYLKEIERNPDQWEEDAKRHMGFLEDLLSLFEVVMQRQTMNEDLLDTMLRPRSKGGVTNLECFFLNFLRLGYRLMQTDCDALDDLSSSSDEAMPDILLSRKYIDRVWWVFAHPPENPLYTYLERTGRFDTVEFSSALAFHFFAQSNHVMESFLGLTRRFIQFTPRVPSYQRCLWWQLNTVERVTQLSVRLSNAVLDTPREVPVSLEIHRMMQPMLEFLRLLHGHIHVLVEKQSSIFTTDMSKSMIDRTVASLRDVALCDPVTALELAKPALEDNELEEVDDYAELVYYLWKLPLLRTCITKGRMEIRVQAVDMMGEELVGAWNRYIKINPPAGVKHSSIRYLSKFLKDAKMIEYLVGVDSHPQLIARSKNVVGFLAVTFHYTNEDSDRIWEAATTNPDSRFVISGLQLLVEIFQFLDMDKLVHLCKKLEDLHITLFNETIVRFAINLLEVFGRQQPNPIASPSLAPFNLCVRLIREAAGNPEVLPDLRQAILNFATNQLPAFIKNGSLESDRFPVLCDCVQAMADHSPNVVGSILVINVLTSRNRVADIKRLSLEFPLASMLIDDFVVALSKFNEMPTSIKLTEVMQPRLELLEWIILTVPDTIQEKLLNKLFEPLFNSGDLGMQGLEWHTLSHIANSCQTRNPVIDLFLEKFFPRVNPKFFTLDVLTFALASLRYEGRLQTFTACEHEIIRIPGVDRIWRILLTAPAENVEVSTSKSLISIYLDDPIRKAPATAIQATHLDLVDRCVKQLTSAAAKLKSFAEGTTSDEDEVMVVVPTESEVELQELKFTRSLLFLREFLQGMRSRQMYSPSFQPQPQYVMKGEAMDIKYQLLFNGNKHTTIRTLRVGDLDTAEEFGRRIVKLTGITKFTVISAGRIMDLSTVKSQTLADLQIGTSGLVIIRKHADSEQLPVREFRTNLSSIDAEVLQHFDQLYDLLELDEKLAGKLYELLTQFPSQKQIMDLVRCVDKDVTVGNLFPPGRPYKILYNLRALEAVLDEQLGLPEEDESFFFRSIQMLAEALSRKDILEAASTKEFQLSIAQRLVECLLAFLRADTQSGTTVQYFADDGIVRSLLDLISASQDPLVLDSPHSQYLMCRGFECLIHACTHSRQVWETLKREVRLEQLLKEVLLDEQREKVREGIAAVICSLCGTLPSSTTAETVELLPDFWKGLVNLLPSTTGYYETAQELLQLASVVFTFIGEMDISEKLPYQKYFDDWSSELLAYKHHEVIGVEKPDHVVFGLVRLLKCCIQLTEAAEIKLEDSDLIKKLYKTFLYPELSSSVRGKPMNPITPILDSSTRGEMYSLMLALCHEEARKLEGLLHLVKNLIPSDYALEPNFNFDRSKALRSSTGYVGLRNLSNTCYLNSLFTQLYMNLDFRKFMLEINIPDRDGSQRLLCEMQKVFAYMQDSWLKFVDPQGITDSIRTFDNEPIDVTNQMDVDEFYNLLFDRLESQILSDEDKKKFRSFYGGHLVQQIKSQECTHVSERIEPFSAIQCDIKGNDSLEDSLRAYVSGDPMQGDNKYKCEPCNRHVNAVKRACLKEIPDNMIFHLKRFDFDMNTMQRSKINDTFEFPMQINLAPYHISGIDDTESDCEADMFELVGVLVHSGTAESGHYYSYIRERPNPHSGYPQWVEYNDADVTRYNPKDIPDSCFGGFGDHMGFTYNANMQKAWNAYMLFYQRVSSMQNAERDFVPDRLGAPARVSPPIELGNHIAMENELFVRQYCLFDPTYCTFIKELVEKLKDSFQDRCSQRHAIEEQCFVTAWYLLEHVIIRSKDLPEFDGFMNLFDEINKRCVTCNKISMEYITRQPNTFRNLLLRNPQVRVRESFSRFVLSSLKYAKESGSEKYGLQQSQIDDLIGYQVVETDGIFQAVISCLMKLWWHLPVHSRSWDDYFGLVTSMALMGEFEVGTVIKSGFFLRILELLAVDQASIRNLRNRYGQYMRLLDKGRRYSFVRLLDLFKILISKMELLNNPVRGELDRPWELQNGYSMTSDEHYLFFLDMPKPRLIPWMGKMLELQQNTNAVRDILSIVLRQEPELGLYHGLIGTITSGLLSEPADLAAPYLQAAIVFCEWSYSWTDVKSIISQIAKDMDSLNGNGGREHLEFLQQLIHCHNTIIKRGPLHFAQFVTRKAPDWAPPLLIFWDDVVREGCINLLKDLVFHRNTDSLSEEDATIRIRDVGRILCQSCIKTIQVKCLNSRQQPLASVVVEIQNVVRYCLELYFDSTSEEDKRIIQVSQTTLKDLSFRAIDEIDDAGSEEWDESAVASESDPLQSE